MKNKVNFILMTIAITTYKDIGKLKGSKAYLMKAYRFIKWANGIFNTNSKIFCFMTLRMAQEPWWLHHFLKYIQPLTELQQKSQQSLTMRKVLDPQTLPLPGII